MTLHIAFGLHTVIYLWPIRGAHDAELLLNCNWQPCILYISPSWFFKLVQFEWGNVCKKLFLFILIIQHFFFIMTYLIYCKLFTFYVFNLFGTAITLSYSNVQFKICSLWDCMTNSFIPVGKARNVNVSLSRNRNQ